VGRRRAGRRVEGQNHRRGVGVYLLCCLEGAEFSFARGGVAPVGAHLYQGSFAGRVACVKIHFVAVPNAHIPYLRATAFQLQVDHCFERMSFIALYRGRMQPKSAAVRDANQSSSQLK